MEPTTIVGKVLTSESGSRTVILRLQEGSIDWSEFNEDTAAEAFARLAEAEQGRPVYYTQRTISLERVKSVRLVPPDPAAQPRRPGTLEISTGGILGNYEVVCACEDDCPWEAFQRFGEIVHLGMRRAQGAERALEAGSSPAKGLRWLASRLRPRG